MKTPEQGPLPIQPVNKPILCSPYRVPDKHWVSAHQIWLANEEEITIYLGRIYDRQRHLH